MVKRRFGVSIDSRISAELDNIAKNLNMDRSKIVEIALQNYITEHKHLSSKHNCRGIVIMKTISSVPFDKILEDYRSIIVNYLHSHIENECICIVFVSGDSEHISNLNRCLITCGCLIRYLPLH
ncbi:MAG: ribbon-helix-helix domain-containing protein [Ignisphaera sp.]|nr:ribbon-helix-helix domain-containing protein [Ignisphaera sp.]MCX8167497.1 ribbon-helix-helix domain-containing protein [Ignisphaera sp.]MDW8084639.1 ribbon-helix-helix domain-containing protein [Ignisphaera sp.]